MSDDTPNNAPLPVTIVLDTHSTDPDFNGDCDYAAVQLTPELVDQFAAAWNWLVRQVARTTTFTNCTSGAALRSSTTADWWMPARKP